MKVEISKVEMDKELLKIENSGLQTKMTDQNILVEELEKELVMTKQKLGDVYNEMSEVEQAKINVDKTGDKNKKFSFFSKKK